LFANGRRLGNEFMRQFWPPKRVRKKFQKAKPKPKEIIYVKQTAWYKAHPELTKKSKPQFIQSLPKMMVAKNEYFEGTALWKRIIGQWSCVEASEHLKWMLKMEPAQAKLELARRGFDWKWQAQVDAQTKSNEARIAV
jgi:hypothetical protein